jgi:hypothetical protein
MQCHKNMSVLSIPHQKKSFCYTCRRRTHNRWHIALNPVVSSNSMTYTNVVSVPTKKHNIHDIHHLNERYLPSYLVIGASLQKSKLHKLRAERKS